MRIAYFIVKKNIIAMKRTATHPRGKCSSMPPTYQALRGRKKSYCWRRCNHATSSTCAV
jgi:hypothetical protein